MKKLFINTVYFLCVCCMAILMPFGLTSCSGDDKPFVDNEPVVFKGGGDIVKGISVTLSDFESADAKTRTAYSDAEGGIKVTWAQGDTIGIFPNEGGQVEFPIQAGTESNEATFDGGGWALRATSTYAAYYPYSKWNVFRDNETILLDYTGQKQDANGSTTHLCKYDYQATGGVQTNSSGYLNFQFQHLGALMVFQLTVPKAGTYTSLTLTSSEDVFVTKAELDISGKEPVLKLIETSSTFTLSLDDIELESENSELTAYMMLAPVDLSDGSLELTLNGSTSYTTSLTGHPLEAGKQYSIDSSLIEVDTSPIIEFADDNVKAICVENWDTNGDGELSMNEAVNIKEIGSVFQWSEIKSFNEFQFFTGVNYISNYAFSGCSSLTSIVIPENVTYIDDFIFEGCDNLTNIICLAKNPPYLFEASFAIRENWDDEGYWYDYVSCICVPLESVNAYKTAMGSYVEVLGLIFKDEAIEDGVIVFADANAKAFCVQNFDKNGDGELSLIEAASVTDFSGILGSNSSNIKSFDEFKFFTSVTSIGRHAFSGYSSLTSIVIPESVTSIGINAFYGCRNLASIVIPESVISIDSYAFSGCSSLTSIVIPESVTSINSYAFSGCSSLTNVTSERLYPPTVGSNAFYDISSVCTLTIPANTKDKYFNAGWTANVFKGGIIDLSKPENINYDGRCFTAKNIEDVDVNYTITSTSQHTVQIGWASPKEYWDKSKVAIDINTSGNFTIPEKVVFNDMEYSVTYIANAAFMKCSELTSISIPESVTHIGHAAFDGCSGLTSLYIPDSVTSIDDGYAFVDCTNLVSIRLSKNIKELPNDTFTRCSSLISITIPEGVTNVGRAVSGNVGDAFWKCESLTTVIIPSTVTFYVGNSFSECNKLKTVKVLRAEPVSIESKSFPNRRYATLYVPSGSKAAYEAAMYWNEFYEIREISE